MCDCTERRSIAFPCFQTNDKEEQHGRRDDGEREVDAQENLNFQCIVYSEQLELLPAVVRPFLRCARRRGRHTEGRLPEEKLEVQATESN